MVSYTVGDCSASVYRSRSSSLRVSVENLSAGVGTKPTRDLTCRSKYFLIRSTELLVHAAITYRLLARSPARELESPIVFEYAVASE